MGRDLKWNDERTEILISSLLRTGLVIATLVVLIGGVFYLHQYGAEIPRYGVFQAEPHEMTSLQGIVGAVMNLDSRAIIQLGLICLILTPIARVVFSAAAFLILKDYLYASVTLFVLVVLMYNFFKS
jgi:uncharacterized membrane protein